jgi:hypothetical protein
LPPPWHQVASQHAAREAGDRQQGNSFTAHGDKTFAIQQANSAGRMREKVM